MYDAQPAGKSAGHADGQYLAVRLRKPANSKRGTGPRIWFVNTKPVLGQLAENDESKEDFGVGVSAQWALRALRSMRFLDLRPEAMRIPSVPGQIVLGDRGENLSSVLQAICETPKKKRAVLEWIRALTPLDVEDFDFVADQTGKILVTLIESGGQRTSAYSASDGTLRFLAMIAAMQGPNPARFYFVEELDTGIHPTRLHLLVQLIEQTVRRKEIQVVGTTHSPQLLAMLSAEAREQASLVYRLEDAPEGRIRRIVDMPDARRVLEQQSIGRLHEVGWLEDTMAFAESSEVSS
jgi:hypothetical protein